MKMSTVINKMLSTANVNWSKQAVVRNQQKGLAEFVREVMREKGLTYREVSRRSGYVGPGSEGLSHTTVFDIVNERTNNIKRDTLRALAKGLGEPEERLVSIVYGTPRDRDGFDESEFALMYSRVRKLTAQQKRDFRVAWDMAKAHLEKLERGGQKEE